MEPTSQSQHGYTSFSHHPAPTQPSPSDIQAGESGQKWEWDDNERWMSHASRVGCCLWNLRQQRAVREELFSKSGCHRNSSRRGPRKAKTQKHKACTQNMTSFILMRPFIQSDAVVFQQMTKIPLSDFRRWTKKIRSRLNKRKKWNKSM